MITLTAKAGYTDADTDGVEQTYQQVDYIISKLRNDGWAHFLFVAERGRYSDQLAALRSRFDAWR